jgi:hypothetical protein
LLRPAGFAPALYAGLAAPDFFNCGFAAALLAILAAFALRALSAVILFSLFLIPFVSFIAIF